MTDNEAFVHQLKREVPETRDLLVQHIAEQGELLPHVFMGDGTRFIIRLHQETLGGASDARALLDALFSLLERAAAEGPEDVQEMITVSFLESVAHEMSESTDFRSFLGPTLRRELRLVLDAFGYPPLA